MIISSNNELDGRILIAQRSVKRKHGQERICWCRKGTNMRGYQSRRLKPEQVVDTTPVKTPPKLEKSEEEEAIEFQDAIERSFVRTL